MHVIHARNVAHALPLGCALLAEHGVVGDSRNGPVVVANAPVTTITEHPRERVLLNPTRDANPFFHLMEGLWMLAGRDDVKFLTRYAKQLAAYSDDGQTMHGAYGKRWVDWFMPSVDGVPKAFDQLGWVINTLREDPDSRRCVIQMWDADIDPLKASLGGKDVPCNTAIYVLVREGKLEITVTCRSNDMLWGAHGANAVHFSMLQEYLAAGVGVGVGRMFQVSNNYHAYEKTLPGEVAEYIMRDHLNPYDREDRNELIEPFPMVGVDLATWREDLGVFMDEGPIVGFRDPFFRRVVTPVELAHQHYRKGRGEDRYVGALEIIEQCAAADWRVACREWLQRRYDSWQRKSDDGVGE